MRVKYIVRELNDTPGEWKYFYCAKSCAVELGIPVKKLYVISRTKTHSTIRGNHEIVFLNRLARNRNTVLLPLSLTDQHHSSLAIDHVRLSPRQKTTDPKPAKTKTCRKRKRKRVRSTRGRTAKASKTVDLSRRERKARRSHVDLQPSHPSDRTDPFQFIETDGENAHSQPFRL